ncbi:hypothetical protein [Streptomyces avermitilis]|uniref:hypothetical protein n=1 Tax=Streptomyces avermitilis TaxID=33903 RepID=UPI0036A6E15C
MTLLCTGPVRAVFSRVVEPRMEWAFRTRTTTPVRAEARGHTDRPHLAAAGPVR